MLYFFCIYLLFAMFTIISVCCFLQKVNLPFLGKIRVERELNKAVGKRMERRSEVPTERGISLNVTDLRGVSVKDLIRLLGKTLR